MGYFSWNCKACGLSVRPREATDSTSRWMSRAVVLTPDGKKSGTYDGYGNIENDAGNDFGTLADDYGQDLEFYHQACYNIVGQPKRLTSPSTTARDQGYFVTEDPPEPRTPDDITKLKSVDSAHSVLKHMKKESTLSLKALLLEDDAPAQGAAEYENGDSLDAQVDRYLSDYESSSRTAKHEGKDFRMLVKRLMSEADEEGGDDADAETEDTPAPEPKKPGADAIDIEEFANNVARLIENYDTLLEVRSTMLRRSINFVTKNYDQSVAASFERTMRDKHGVVDGETKQEVDDDMFPAPPADRAGPGGAGA